MECSRRNQGICGAGESETIRRKSALDARIFTLAPVRYPPRSTECRIDANLLSSPASRRIWNPYACRELWDLAKLGAGWWWMMFCKPIYSIKSSPTWYMFDSNIWEPFLPNSFQIYSDGGLAIWCSVSFGLQFFTPRKCFSPLGDWWSKEVGWSKAWPLMATAAMATSKSAWADGLKDVTRPCWRIFRSGVKWSTEKFQNTQWSAYLCACVFTSKKAFGGWLALAACHGVLYYLLFYVFSNDFLDFSLFHTNTIYYIHDPVWLYSEGKRE